MEQTYLVEINRKVLSLNTCSSPLFLDFTLNNAKRVNIDFPNISAAESLECLLGSYYSDNSQPELRKKLFDLIPTNFSQIIEVKYHKNDKSYINDAYATFIILNKCRNTHPFYRYTFYTNVDNKTMYVEKIGDPLASAVNNILQNKMNITYTFKSMLYQIRTALIKANRCGISNIGSEIRCVPTKSYLPITENGSTIYIQTFGYIILLCSFEDVIISTVPQNNIDGNFATIRKVFYDTVVQSPYIDNYDASWLVDERADLSVVISHSQPNIGIVECIGENNVCPSREQYMSLYNIPASRYRIIYNAYVNRCYEYTLIKTKYPILDPIIDTYQRRIRELDNMREQSKITISDLELQKAAHCLEYPVSHTNVDIVPDDIYKKMVFVPVTNNETFKHNIQAISTLYKLSLYYDVKVNIDKMEKSKETLNQVLQNKEELMQKIKMIDLKKLNLKDTKYISYFLFYQNFVGIDLNIAQTPSLEYNLLINVAYDYVEYMRRK